MNAETDITLELAARLRWALVRMARRLRQEAGSGIGPSLTAALATVERHGPLTPSELAEREAIKRPAATRIVARLEEEGLVARSADPDDGRVALIAATAAGSELLAAARARKNEYLARRLAELDADDLAAVARTADVLERLLEDGRR
ncbi:MAG: MarR family transcriptional regulator [Solirubrobacterales bacterium]|nr:MarR family transcriptional regulator [Solirubrobacterales bacterium]